MQDGSHQRRRLCCLRWNYGLFGLHTLECLPNQRKRRQLSSLPNQHQDGRNQTRKTIYGGVPIVDYVQDPILGKDGDGSDLIKPRRTTKECVDFICKDFERAASMLPARWTNEAQDFGRITSGLAQAMLGKMLLYYASPVFNRADDPARWEAAYTANKLALEKLKAGNFGLAYSNDGGVDNGANWAKIWMNYTGSDGNISEAVFVTLHNTKANVSGQPDYGKYNNWEHTIRPKNTNGNGGLTPTSEMIDLFPMADGLKPGESSIPYNKLNFWLNRDPRFYRTLDQLHQLQVLYFL